jgi:lipopolysaccharide export system permease protein
MAASRTLSRYLTGRFVLAIMGTFVLCSLLIFMIDMVEMLRQSSKYGKVAFGKLVWITLLRLPAYTEFLLAFAVLVGSIGALLMLSRKSELTVMRAGGMSAWQFLQPGLRVAIVVGVVAVVAYNPMAAAARAEGERLFAQVFGRDANLLRTESGGSWLRQDGADGQSVISAVAASNRGLSLTGVTVFTFDAVGTFAERIDASRAELKEGYWRIENGWLARVGREPEKFQTYLLSTYLTPERVADALGTVISVSFWDLPGLIEVAEKAKLSSARLHIQYQTLLARPLMCVAMVFLAATVSLRSFRSGGIQTMVISGMLGGFGFFLAAEVSRQIGVAGFVPPWAAVWLPILLLLFVTTTVLLHQEDG